MQFTAGKITNIMSTDSTRLEFLFYYGFYLWSAPLQVLISCVFLVFYMGWSSMAGAATLLALIPVQALITKWLNNLTAETIKKTDMRLELTTEMLRGNRPPPLSRVACRSLADPLLAFCFESRHPHSQVLRVGGRLPRSPGRHSRTGEPSPSPPARVSADLSRPHSCPGAAHAAEARAHADRASHHRHALAADRHAGNVTRTFRPKCDRPHRPVRPSRCPFGFTRSSRRPRSQPPRSARTTLPARTELNCQRLASPRLAHEPE